MRLILTPCSSYLRRAASPTAPSAASPTAAEGGVEHCQGDLFSIGIDWMADWVAEVLAAPPGRPPP